MMASIDYCHTIEDAKQCILQSENGFKYIIMLGITLSSLTNLTYLFLVGWIISRNDVVWADELELPIWKYLTL